MGIATGDSMPAGKGPTTSACSAGRAVLPPAAASVARSTGDPVAAAAAAGSGLWRPSGGRRHRTTAITANEAAFRKKARAIPLIVMRIAPIAGPMTKARLSSVDQALLAGPSSRSSRTRLGR